MPLTTTPAFAAGDKMPALLAFAALMRQQNPAFDLYHPQPAAGGNALTVGNWAIGIDQSGPPTHWFGKHGNCNAQTRCVGCIPFCEAEGPAVDLSVQCGGRSGLWIEVSNSSGNGLQMSVRTFVPGRPAQSDVWFPITCPTTGMLVLFASSGSREARVRNDGQLMMSEMVPSAGYAVFAANVFRRSWLSLVKQLAEGRGSSGTILPATLEGCL
jgi:hypothetical protein